MKTRAVLGALILQQASCARLVDVQEAADESAAQAVTVPVGFARGPSRDWPGTQVVRLENRGVGPGGDVSLVPRGDRPVDNALDAALALRGGGEEPALALRGGAWKPGHLFNRGSGAGMRALNNRQLRRIINGLNDQHVREFGCMWPDATLHNLIKELPETTLRKLAKGFVRRFPGGFVYAYALNLPVWGLRTVALNLPWGVLRAIPRHVPMWAIRDMIHTMPDDLFRATIDSLPDSAMVHLAKNRKRWGPALGKKGLGKNFLKKNKQ